MMMAMALRTAFTELFSLQHPIALAPMGGSAGGALAAAVSNGGGLGLLGGGNGDHGWLDRELPIVAEGTDKPWGVGFQSWAIDVATVEHVLKHNPRTVMLSFGDPRAFVAPIRRPGAGDRRCRSCRSWWTWPRRRRCWPPAGSPMGGAWRRPWFLARLGR